VHFNFDGKVLKTEKEPIGGGDVVWKKFHWEHDWNLVNEHASQLTFSFVKQELLEKKLTIEVQFTEKTKGSSPTLGTCAVDLWTIATGPVNHNLPLEVNGKSVGRIGFSVEMVEYSDIICRFQDVSVLGLKPIFGEDQLNSMLKFGYSKVWNQIEHGKLKAIYSEIIENDFNPSWNDLPILKFKAPLNDMISQSIVLHVVHKTKNKELVIGRCLLLFRSLVEGSGEDFKEDDLIEFGGPLESKTSDIIIKGHLTFRNLPHFAQMRPINPIKDAVNTEKGVIDAVSILSWLPKPEKPIILTESTSISVLPGLRSEKMSIPEQPEKIIVKSDPQKIIAKSEPQKIIAKSNPQKIIVKSNPQNEPEVKEPPLMHRPSTPPEMMSSSMRSSDLIDFSDEPHLNFTPKFSKFSRRSSMSTEMESSINSFHASQRAMQANGSQKPPSNGIGGLKKQGSVLFLGSGKRESSLSLFNPFAPNPFEVPIKKTNDDFNPFL